MSLLVGVLVTVLAALVPARRATQALPVEALREATPGHETFTRRRAAAGFTMIVAGSAGVLATVYGSSPMTVFGLGLVCALVGVIVCSPDGDSPLGR